MKILVHDYVGHAFPVQLSRELARCGHDVIHGYAGGLVTPRGELCRQTDDPTKLNFREFHMSPNYRKRKYSFIWRHRYEVSYGRGLSQFVKTWRPNLVVSGNTPSHPQLQLAKACRLVGAKFVSWVQDLYGLAVQKLARKKFPILGVLAGSWYLRMDRQAFRLSSGVIVISEDFVPLVTSVGVPPTRILILPNWAPLGEVSVRPRVNSWGTRHGFASGFNFMYTGTLAMKHNPELLVRLAQAFQGEPGVRIIVVSEGPGSDWIATENRRFRLTNVHLLPFQPFREMQDVLGTGDVLLAVLEPDAGFFSVPSKVLTYHCAGRPVLAAIPQRNLAARIIVGAGSGIVVDSNDWNGFVKGAIALKDDAERRSRMGTLARSYAEDNFPIQKVLSRFQLLLDELDRS